MSTLASIIFLSSIAIVLYILFGYPLLLTRIAKRRPRPFHRDAALRTVSVIVTVRDGERFIADKLNSILQQNYPRDLMEILVISDGSTDRTDEIAASFAEQGVRLVRVPRLGKPAAINTAISLANNEILQFNDVRQLLDQACLRHLLAGFGDPEVGVVGAEMRIREGPASNRDESIGSLYWRYELGIRRNMSTIDSTFGPSGHCYAIRRALAGPIPQDTLLDDVALPLPAFFRGFRIVLEPDARSFEFPTNLDVEFPRKVRTQAGLLQILRRHPELLTGRNRMRFHFLSAKFSRLLLPWLLLLAAACSLFLPSPWAMTALASQVLFYLAAAVDPVGLPRLKKITGPVRAFVVLAFAAAVALRVFFVPAQDIWKPTKIEVSKKARPL